MMIGDIKIKIGKDPATGETCVPPEVMRILMDFGAHQQICEECEVAYNTKTGAYCVAGQSLMDELMRQPEVEFIVKDPRNE